MINRREFVKLGSSALSSMWLASDARALANPGGDPGNSSAAAGKAPANAAWPRPTIIPLPKEVSGVSHPLIDLAGTWKLTTSPPSDFWINAVDPAGWTNITVPGELAAQGIPFARDNEFAFERSVEIPADAVGRKIVLRFEGVYSYARVWVNGKFVREHHGGFTSWDCDITDTVTPGQPAWITVGVTDRSDEISYASNYAKHYIGGILRSVRLVILPATHVSRLHVETDFDSTYKNATLKVMAGVARRDTGDVKLNLRLLNPEGKEIAISPRSLTFAAGKQEVSIEIPVSSPVKWDCEHPNLYTLEAELTVGKSSVEKLAKKFGKLKCGRTSCTSTETR
jgi:beta-galactosidase/beta-glucuronidase